MNREDFQIFDNYKKETGNELVYLDNASTSQVPNQVLNAINDYYTNYKSNIDRGLYKIEEKATQKFEESRKKVAKFLNVNDDEVIFTSGATDSSNKLMMLIEKHLSKYPDLYKTKNEILVSVNTHHSELLPLQEYAKRNNLIIKIIDTKNNLEEFQKEISEKTLLVSLQLVSNVTGLILKVEDVKKIVVKCKELHAFSICDISAGVGHMNIDLKDLDCDAAYFSAHKMCGPTGVGVLFVKREYSRDMSPTNFGGGMVWQVEDKESSYRSDIKLFEAGTQNISGVIGFGAAIDYINILGLEKIQKHNQELLKYFYEKLESEENKNIKNNIKIYSEENLENNIGIISFAIGNFEKVNEDKNGDENREESDKLEIVHPHDVAQILSCDNVCVRAGHHCAQLLMKSLDVSALTRASFYFYNTEKDIDQFFTSLQKVLQKFSI